MTDSSAGLYTNVARDSRMRDEMVRKATSDLTTGLAAKAVTGSNNFGFRLLNAVDADGNVMVSPLSIATALSMTMNGANGKTLLEMQKTLGVDKLSVQQIDSAAQSMREIIGSTEKSSASLNIANSIWAKKDFKFEPLFLTAGQTAFGAKLTDVDFNAPEGYRQINDWVKTATEGKIDKIIGEDPQPDLKMVLVNAIYFKAGWKDKFDAEGTKSGEFHTAEDKTSTVDYMNRSGKMQFNKSDWASVVRLPYGDQRFEMVLAMPEGKQEMGKFINKLGADTNWLPTEVKQVALTMPKWKSRYEKELKETLSKLGMPSAFSNDADFSNMSKEEKLKIDKVIHKSFVDVNEEGTEAAAATAVTMKPLGIMVPTIVKFDRPFVYMIREVTTGQVLFLGVMRNPATAG